MPYIKVTSAPLSAKARAIESPIFPLDLFVIIRIGSIGSAVAPAVTKTFFPVKSVGYFK